MDQNLDLNGRLIRVAINEPPPYVFLDYENSTKSWLVKNGGFEGELFHTMIKHFNFSYQIINCFNDYGIKFSNNSWSGAMGKIVSKSADIGLGGLRIINERLGAVHFSNPHIINSITFITPAPKTVPIITLVVKPFDFSVWICFILAVVFMLFNLWLISKYYIELKNISLKWAIICSSLRQQLSCRLPSVIPLRLVFYSWLLACVVLTTSYGGCLYSLMAIPSREKTINTVMELAIAQTNGQIQVTAIEKTSYYHSLKNAKFGVYRDIGQLIRPVVDMNEGIDRVINSAKAHALIASRDGLYYSMLTFGEKLFHLPPQTQDSSFGLNLMAIAMRKDFQYKKQFNRFISNIRKGGFLDYWRHKQNRKLTNRPDRINFDFETEDDNEDKRLSLDQFQSTFYMFSIGIFSSSLIMLIEFIRKKYFIRV